MHDTDRRSKKWWECDIQSVNKPLIDSDPQNLLSITLDVPLHILVDSHPTGHPPLSYLALQEFHSLDVIASRHFPRHSRYLRVPAASSP